MTYYIVFRVCNSTLWSINQSFNIHKRLPFYYIHQMANIQSNQNRLQTRCNMQKLTLILCDQCLIDVVHSQSFWKWSHICFNMHLLNSHWSKSHWQMNHSPSSWKRLKKRSNMQQTNTHSRGSRSCHQSPNDK